GMALALYALAWMIEMRRLRDALKTIVLTAVIALTHLHATALVGVTALLMAVAKAKPARAFVHHALSMAGFLLLLPWTIARLFPGPGHNGHVTVENAPWDAKISSLYSWSLDTIPWPEA